MTKKEERQFIFNKYDGRCAYCSEELKKGWHVDELMPVIRNRSYIKAGFFNKHTKLRKQPHEKAINNPDFEWKLGRYVNDGCQYPERFNLDNQMPSCASCNINKHSGSLEEFRSLIQGFKKHLNGVNTQYKITKRYGLVVEVEKPVVFYFETFKKQSEPQLRLLTKEEIDTMRIKSYAYAI